MIKETIKKKEIKDFFKEADRITKAINIFDSLKNKFNQEQEPAIKEKFFALLNKIIIERDVKAWLSHMDLIEVSIETF